MSDRIRRITSLLRELAATFIQSEANPQPLITVTGADISSDLKHATVLVSVFPEAQEQDAIVFLKRKGGDFRAFVKQRANLKDIPFFDFAIDYGEKSRQQLDHVAE
jgi:ribosome-binding factor A